jgi:AcrR family transcriptional regulator
VSIASSTATSTAKIDSSRVEPVAVPGRPLRADARRNYDAILSVAGAAFRENGVNASLDEIAKRAGVGPGTLYRHFPNRECLVAAALVENRVQLSERFAELSVSADAGAALHTWMLSMAEHIGTFDGLPDTVAQAAQEGDSPLGLSCGEMTQATQVLLSRAQAAGAVRADVTGDDIFLIANSLAWATQRCGYSSSDHDRLLNLVTTGLK